jgi:hypothetical protein
MLAECKFCGELHPSALMARGDGFVCGNCDASARGRPSKLCPRCGRMAPFEGHHVNGRRNSPEKVPLCINCHRIAHAMNSRRTRCGEGANIGLSGAKAL